MNDGPLRPLEGLEGAGDEIFAACTSTWMVTSSGMRLRSMSSRTKSKSGWEAAGKPTSMCLKPMWVISAHICSFWATVMGSTSAWLPSRRSTAHQSGARSSTRLGHWRSARLITGHGGICDDRSSYSDSLDGWARHRTTGPTGGWGKERKRVGAVTPSLTSRAAVTPRPVFLRPPSVTGAGHGSRIGLRALISRTPPFGVSAQTTLFV